MFYLKIMTEYSTVFRQDFPNVTVVMAMDQLVPIDDSNFDDTGLCCYTKNDAFSPCSNWLLLKH